MPIFKGSSPQHPGYPTGAGTFSTFPGPVAGQAVAAVDQIYLYPFVLLQPITLTAAQLRVTAVGTGSSAKTGVWANGLNTAASAYRPLGAPLLADNTGVATTGTGNVVVPMAGSLSPGLYWIGTKHTGTLPSMQGIASSNNYFAWFAGFNGSALISTGLAFADAYANNMPTFTATSSFALNGNGVPIVGFTT